VPVAAPGVALAPVAGRVVVLVFAGAAVAGAAPWPSIYTAAFTPSSSPLTNITGTSLLILQNNRFKDNSTTFSKHPFKENI
jgi:hypothetical protein